MSLREERFEIRVDATPEDVWWALTTSEGLSAWFGTRATVEVRVDGERVVGWGDREEIRATLSEIEPGRRVRAVYLADGTEIGSEEWLISVDGASTRLTMINSMPDDGIDDWEGYYGDIRRGWRLFLACLRHSLVEADSRIRRAQPCYIDAPGERTEIRRRLTHSLDGASNLLAGMDPAIDDPPHSLLLVASDRTLLLDIEGAGESQVVYAQAADHGAGRQWCSEVLDVVRSAFD